MTPAQIRDWITRMGYSSQRESAEALGISTRWLEMCLAGKFANGKPAKLSRSAEKLATSLAAQKGVDIPNIIR